MAVALAKFRDHRIFPGRNSAMVESTPHMCDRCDSTSFVLSLAALCSWIGEHGLKGDSAEHAMPVSADADAGHGHGGDGHHPAKYNSYSVDWYVLGQING